MFVLRQDPLCEDLRFCLLSQCQSNEPLPAYSAVSPPVGILREDLEHEPMPAFLDPAIVHPYTGLQ